MTSKSATSSTAQKPASSTASTTTAPVTLPETGESGALSATTTGRRRTRPWLRRAVLAGCVLLALAIVTVGAALWMDAHGRAFFAAGRSAVVTLDAVAAALAAGDAEALSALHSPGFSAPPPLLHQAALFEEKDGVRRYRLGAAAETATLHSDDSGDSDAPVDRAGAVAGWRRYLASFASVDELRLHLHRVQDWDAGGPVEASVRFELIGTPRGEARAGIDRAMFDARFEPTREGGFVLASLHLREGERQVATRPHFRNVAAAAGIDFENRFYPAFLDRPLRFEMLRFGPAGISVADVDGDGFQDLFIPDGVESRLFRNRGDGTFEDVTAAAGLSGLSGVSVALFADFDNDGDPDLFVSRTFEPNQLFENRGDGTFLDVTAASGLGADCCTTVASWADYDLDGDLDLYVGRYLDPRKAIPTTFYARNGEPNRLYRNDGEGRFTDVTEAAGVGETGLCLGTAFGDYDDDGHPDLYVANDFGRKTLYRNQGDGTFRDVTVETGTLAYGAGMSASFGDYDNDGRLDIYVAHIRSEHAWFAEAPTVARYMANSFRQGTWRTDMPLYFEIFRQSGFAFVDVFQQMASGNTLLRNRGDGSFEDVTWETGANPPGWFWGSNFADFDNDGWQDLYSANGWVYGDPGTEIELDFLNAVVGDQRRYKSGELFDPDSFGGESWHGYERNQHLRNDRGTFVEIGRAAGTDLLLNSRGTAVADFWNRGVLDLAVAASTGRHALLRNEVGTRRPFLALELEGAGRRLPDGSNRDAVGARVTLTYGGLTQTREVVLGDGYGSQSTLRLHFGLGVGDRDAPPEVDEIPVVDEILVRWPRSGREQRFTDVPANRILRLVEGRDELVEAVPVNRGPAAGLDAGTGVTGESVTGEGATGVERPAAP